MDIVRVGEVTIAASKISTRRVGRRIDCRGHYWSIFGGRFGVNFVVDCWIIGRFFEVFGVRPEPANDLDKIFIIQRVIMKAWSLSIL